VSISQILVHVWSLPRRYVHKTGIKVGLVISYGLKPIAYLKKLIRKKENKNPKYLRGKKKNVR